jgi:CheY-like chemotaxis protein
MPADRPLRLLWIDDEPELLYSPDELITLDLGWELDWAICVRTAAEALVSQHYDIVLVDQMMPFEAEPQLPRQEAIVVTAGALLIHWLRLGTLSKDLTGATELRQLGWLPPHQGVIAHGNQDASVIMVTGWEPTTDVINAVGDLIEPGVPFRPFIKPVDEVRLRIELERLAAARPSETS